MRSSAILQRPAVITIIRWRVLWINLGGFPLPLVLHPAQNLVSLGVLGLELGSKVVLLFKEFHITFSRRFRGLGDLRVKTILAQQATALWVALRVLIQLLLVSCCFFCC